MNAADQQLIDQRMAGAAKVLQHVCPLERLSSELERNGYFPKLAKIPHAWECTLYRDGATHETPPTGRGGTALEALQSAAGKILVARRG